MNLNDRIEKAIAMMNDLLNNASPEKFDQLNMSAYQIRRIVDELENMGKYMDPLYFRPSYGHMIVDSWADDEDRNIYKELLEIESNYLKLKVEK